MIARNVVTIVAAIVAVSSLHSTLESVLAAPQTQTFVASMEILPTSTDVVSHGAGAYSDYRLVGGDSCTAGEIASTGGVFMFLNRSLAGRFSAGPRCSPNANGALIDRQFAVVVASAAACARLGAGQLPWVSPFDGAACRFTTPQGKAHSVEPGDIFKSKVSRSRATFYINTPAFESVAAQTYRIQTDDYALVYVENPYQRLVTHTGSGTLAVNDGMGYVPYENFALSFEIRFTRTPLTAQ